MTSPASLTITDEGWLLDADSLDVNLDSLSVGDSPRISAPLYFQDVTVADQESLEVGGDLRL